MQTTKEYIRKQLQETACDAFLRKGFKAVSMREISSLSGIGLSTYTIITQARMTYWQLFCLLF